MSDFQFILTILTNGRQVCFERSVDAFFRYVLPAPSAIYVFDDGDQTGKTFTYETIVGAGDRYGCVMPPADRIVHDYSAAPLGMCAAHKNCHDAAAGSEYEWAFHLEDDQVILRPTDLRDLAAVIDAEPTCKQMALVRCPWGREIEFGGYIPQMPGLYERREMFPHGAPHNLDLGLVPRRYEWIATQRNWATSPALMRTDVMREFPWSPVPGCETEIGPRILAAYPDAVFGLWGGGEPHMAHIATERQPGAWGY